jgi:hypothetical protein
MDKALEQQQPNREQLRESHEAEKRLAKSQEIGSKGERAAAPGRTTDAQNVRQETQHRPEKNYPAPVEAENRLATGQRPAYRAAENALYSHESTKTSAADARRYSSEAAARETVGNGAVDLDAKAKEVGGFKGHFFPERSGLRQNPFWSDSYRAIQRRPEPHDGLEP